MRETEQGARVVVIEVGGTIITETVVGKDVEQVVDTKIRD